ARVGGTWRNRAAGDERERGPVRLGLGLAGHRRAAARNARPRGPHPGAGPALVGRGRRLRSRRRGSPQVSREEATVAVTTQTPGTAPRNPLQAFYETPGVPLSSGPDRARRQARMLAGILRDATGP